MKIYSIAKPEDLLHANLVRLRRTLSEDAANYMQMAEGCVDPSFVTAVNHACETADDEPSVRAWSHTMDRLRPFLQGVDAVPNSSAVGHLEADSPHSARLLELLSWEICAAVLPSEGGATLTLPSAPPRILPVGRRGSVILDSMWPTTETWTLQLRDNSIELRRSQTHTKSEDSGWISPLLLRGHGIDAVIPLHQPSLTNRDFQDFPIVRSQAYAVHWGARVISAADALAQYSVWAGSLTRAFVRSILPLVCGDHAIGSASRESALGLVFLPSTEALDQLAECLLHEAMHQYLFRIEECGGVFTDASPVEEVFYSPWRSDSRPLRMTLHGAFVFAAVADLYLWPLAPSALGISDSECHRRAYHRIEQVRVALQIVRRHGTLTRFGEVVANAVEADIATIRDHVAPSAVDRESVDSTIATHLERYGEYVR